MLKINMEINPIEQKYHCYSETNHNFLVEVVPTYIIERSNQENDYYFYSYTVTITNNSDQEYQLLERHWIIRDGDKKVEHIKGEGVVGYQPSLIPGQSFTYSSFCPLRTPTGSMRGSYTLVNQKTGESLVINIPLFFLRPPHTFH